MQSRLVTLWKPRMGVTMRKVGEDKYIFQFFYRLDLKYVLEGDPWSFGNQLLIVHHLQKGEHPLQASLTKVPFLVGLLDGGRGQTTGNFVGKLLEYDKSNKSAVWMTYMQVHVEIDVTHSSEYEKLTYFCYICGLLGYTEKFCNVLNNSSEEVVAQEWEPWKASDQRGGSGNASKWLRTSESAWPEPYSEGRNARVPFEDITGTVNWDIDVNPKN
ncbi:hypothetical protein ACS0TY_029674 [Phlomoides rotata]